MHASYLRQFHANMIFEAIRRQTAISQRDLRDLTGCDRSTVSTIVRHFEETGLVERAPVQQDGRRGRPSDLFRIAETGGLLAGVEVESELTRFVLTSLNGQPIATFGTPTPTDPDRLTDLIDAGIDRLCTTAHRGRKLIRAVGVTLPGLVQHRSLLTNCWSMGWKNVDVGGPLGKRLEMQVHIDNNSSATTLAEHMFGKCADMDDFVLLDSGRGLGGGVFMGGQLIRGQSGLFAEFGHLKLARDGRRCCCGAVGCLSAYLTTVPLIEQARRFTPVADFEEFLALADAGDEDIAYVLQEAGEFLGLGLATIVNLFNPRAVVLARLIARLWPHLERSARRALGQAALAAPLAEVEFITSDISLSPAPLGGIALALEGLTAIENRASMPWWAPAT